jgi:hypothetical protein
MFNFAPLSIIVDENIGAVLYVDPLAAGPYSDSVAGAAEVTTLSSW